MIATVGKIGVLAGACEAGMIGKVLLLPEFRRWLLYMAVIY